MGNSGTPINTGTLTNDHASLTNNGLLTNTDTLSNVSTLTNTGIIVGTGTYIQTANEFAVNSQTINNGSLTQSSVIINGGTLSGTGTITANVTIGSGATVSPGNPFGTLTINGNFASSGNILFEIGGRSAGQFDVLAIHGNAFLNGGTIGFNFMNFIPAIGNSWDFLTASSISGWDSLSFNFSGLGAGETAQFHFHHGIETLRIVGAPHQSTLAMVAVPEPSSLLHLLFGLGGLAVWRKLKGV